MAHRIRPLRRTSIPGHHVAVAVDSDDCEHADGTVTARFARAVTVYFRRRGAGSWTSQRAAMCASPSATLDAILVHAKPRRALRVWSCDLTHTAMALDLFRAMPARGWQFKRGVVGCPPTALTFERDGVSVQWLDTLNIFRLSLPDLGRSIGGLGRHADMATDCPPEYVDAATDAAIVANAIESWCATIADNDLGGLELTGAAQAFSAWRRRLPESTPLVSRNPDYDEFERSAYYGGHCECFRLGHIPGEHVALDVNSAYPHAMRSLEYPTTRHGVYKRISIDELMRIAGEYLVVADVDCVTYEPVLPHRSEHGVIYRVGRQRATVTTREVEYLMQCGVIAKVHRVAVYDHAPLFRQYVDDLYALRMRMRSNGDTAGEAAVKIMLNGLYGKFGQHSASWSDAYRTDDPGLRRWRVYDHTEGRVVTMRQIADLVQIAGQTREAQHAYPAIAAHVTADVRVALWDLVRIAGKSNVVYCDTDSLICTGDGASALLHLIDDAALGSLKVAAYGDCVDIRGIKDYSLGSSIKSAGLRKDATRNNDGTWTQRIATTLKGVMLADQLNDVRYQHVTISRTGEYRLGVVGLDGRVSPHVAADWGFDKCSGNVRAGPGVRLCVDAGAGEGARRGDTFADSGGRPGDGIIQLPLSVSHR